MTNIGPMGLLLVLFFLAITYGCFVLSAVVGQKSNFWLGGLAGFGLFIFIQIAVGITSFAAFQGY